MLPNQLVVILSRKNAFRGYLAIDYLTSTLHTAEFRCLYGFQYLNKGSIRLGKSNEPLKEKAL